MVKVRSQATMFTHLTWEGEVPDDIPEDERWLWIKENIDGGDFTAHNDMFSGGWDWGTEVEILEEEE